MNDTRKLNRRQATPSTSTTLHVDFEFATFIAALMTTTLDTVIASPPSAWLTSTVAEYVALGGSGDIIVTEASLSAAITTAPLAAGTSSPSSATPGLATTPAPSLTNSPIGYQAAVNATDDTTEDTFETSSIALIVVVVVFVALIAVVAGLVLRKKSAERKRRVDGDGYAGDDFDRVEAGREAIPPPPGVHTCSKLSTYELQPTTKIPAPTAGVILVEEKDGLDSSAIDIDIRDGDIEAGQDNSPGQYRQDQV